MTPDSLGRIVDNFAWHLIQAEPQSHLELEVKGLLQNQMFRVISLSFERQRSVQNSKGNSQYEQHAWQQDNS